jgi:hypothetical protein
MHSSLPSGFSYHGTLYTGDQAAIAEGDNCLSIIVPQIMASAAYTNNGVIIIWTDETESTDDTGTTLPYIVISPLCKGNAYASSVVYSHSSDLKTMDEIFGLAFQTNTIVPASIDASSTGYNYVFCANDISDLFKPVPNFVGGQVMLSSGGFQLTFGGPAGLAYQLLASTNLATPQSAWSVATSGAFGGTNITYTDSTATNYGERFYVIKSP